LQDYVSCFALSLKELGQLKKQEVQIVLEDDNLIFRRPYRLNEMERALVQARTTKLLDVGLVELLKGDYASTTMMLAKKDIFGN
jgi:hypothetical protein